MAQFTDQEFERITAVMEFQQYSSIIHDLKKGEIMVIVALMEKGWKLSTEVPEEGEDFTYWVLTKQIRDSRGQIIDEKRKQFPPPGN